ncbi:hypothetical protein [Aeromicrobium sp. 179-A 4D2 NHS]|uniref:hypothetical protein n=1 Tax=Aeromicrobium sp. 179-A 4D2 NHS TaxID=3142375 RepID=UPI0039A1B83F
MNEMKLGDLLTRQIAVETFPLWESRDDDKIEVTVTWNPPYGDDPGEFNMWVSIHRANFYALPFEDRYDASSFRELDGFEAQQTLARLLSSQTLVEVKS